MTPQQAIQEHSEKHGQYHHNIVATAHMVIAAADNADQWQYVTQWQSGSCLWQPPGKQAQIFTP